VRVGFNRGHVAPRDGSIYVASAEANTIERISLSGSRFAVWRGNPADNLKKLRTDRSLFPSAGMAVCLWRIGETGG
jgi:hypothetical protein